MFSHLRSQNKKYIYFLIGLAFSVFYGHPVLAYGGPGVAIGAIIVFFTIVFAFFASFFIKIFNLFKKIFVFIEKRLKSKNNKKVKKRES